MSKLGKRLIEGIKEAINDPDAVRLIRYEKADVAAIRKSLNLSQDKFANRFRLPAATIRDWEHGRRVPDASANNYLLVIKYAPEIVDRALASTGEGPPSTK